MAWFRSVATLRTWCRASRDAPMVLFIDHCLRHLPGLLAERAHGGGDALSRLRAVGGELFDPWATTAKPRPASAARAGLDGGVEGRQPDLSGRGER